MRKLGKVNIKLYKNNIRKYRNINSGSKNKLRKARIKKTLLTIKI